MIKKILNKIPYLGLLIIIAVSSFFRLWKIKSVPGGLFPDEAANGLDIVQSIFKGNFLPFFERGLGREALFFYFQAASIKIFGIGVWQMHIVSAIIGIITVIFVYLFAKRVFNERVAFFGGLLMATSSWHVTLSRTGFRAIMVPLFSTAFFYFSYCAHKEVPGKKRIAYAILSGASLALGLYSYPSFRLVSLIMGIILALVLIIDRKIIKNSIKTILLSLAVFFIIVGPLAVYFAGHIESFFGRAGYVSIFNADQNHGDFAGTLWSVLKKTFWMFFTDGDLNWRHNTSGKSMLSPVSAFFFAIGLIYSFSVILFLLIRKKIFKKENMGDAVKYILLLSWFLILLIPEIMTAEGIPHGLRALGVVPPAFILSAIGVNLFYEKSKKILNGKLVLIILFFIFTINFVYDYNLYFGISANSPEFYYAYRSDLTTVSAYLNERNQKNATYLVLDEYSVQTPEFLTVNFNQPYMLLDPAKSHQVNPKKGDQAVFTQSTIFDAKKFIEYHPQAKLIIQNFNSFGEEILRVYEL